MKAGLEGRLADALVRIEQQILHLLHAHPGQIVGERQPDGLLEHLAEIEGARVDCPRHLLERELLALMIGDVGARPRDHRRLRLLLPHHELVAQRGEVLGEDRQQADDRLILALRHDAGLEISLLDPLEVDLAAPLEQLAGHALELALAGPVQKHLAGLQEGDQVFAHPHGDGGVAQPREAPQGMGLHLRRLGDLLLHLQAGGAGFVGAGEQGAKRILILLAGQRKLKRLHRPQAERQARGLRKRLFVIAPDLRGLEVLDDAFAA